MTCDRSPQEIQLWLDGDLDLSNHASECPSCQSQMKMMAGLRRLSAAPSPLPKDFAQRTATRVIERSRVTPSAPKSGWKLLWSNPLRSILQRQSQLRLNRLPSLALLCLLFSPGLLFQQSSGESRSAYLLVLQLGLGLGIPLLALSRDLTTLSGLVKGRCLEEMVQAGTPAPMLVDTLLVHGLRHLGMALGLSALFLTGLDGGEFLRHLPLLLLGYLVIGYLGSSQILSRSTGLSLAGLTLTYLSWGTHWVYLGLVLTAGLARQMAIKTLTALSQGQAVGSGYGRAPAWQKILARYLPDWALLQRELARQPLFSLAWVALQALGIREAYLSPGAQPIWLGLLSMTMACQVTLREMQNGTLEMLGQSGLKPRHWWQSLGLLNVLKLAPMLLVFTLSLASSTSPSEAFCLGLLLVICIGCATLIGTVITLGSQSSSQVWQSALREGLWFFASSWVVYLIWLSLLNSHEWLRSGLVPEWLVAAAPSVLAWIGRGQLYRKSQVIWWPSLPLVIVASVIPLRFFGDAVMSSVRDGYFALFSLTATWSCLWVWAQSPAPVPLWRLAFSNVAWVCCLSYLSGILMATSGLVDPSRLQLPSPWWPILMASGVEILIGVVLSWRAQPQVSAVALQVARSRNQKLLAIGTALLVLTVGQILLLLSPKPLPGDLSARLDTLLEEDASWRSQAVDLPLYGQRGFQFSATAARSKITHRWTTEPVGSTQSTGRNHWINKEPKPTLVSNHYSASRLIDWHQGQLSTHLHRDQAGSFVETMESLAPYATTPSLHLREELALGANLHLSQALARGLFENEQQLHQVEQIYQGVAALSASQPTFDFDLVYRVRPLRKFETILPAFVLRGWRNKLIALHLSKVDGTIDQTQRLAQFEHDQLVKPRQLMQELFKINRYRLKEGEFPSRWEAPGCAYHKLSKGFQLDYLGNGIHVKVAPDQVIWELSRP
jgi:hypothetical protein